MGGEQLAYNSSTHTKIWSMLSNLSDDNTRDAMLANIGLSRIEKEHTNYYFITTYNGLYKETSNLQIINPQRWMLAQIKHGL